ncbi:Ig-like domain-containing protein, partial [Vibrio coralliilyticus]
MSVSANVIMGNLASGQALVIDQLGNIRVISKGELAKPGEVIMSMEELTPDLAKMKIAVVDQDSLLQDVTGEIDDIIAALEEGQDPTQLGEDFATAAGGQTGSSLTTIGTIVRTGDETIANTDFNTQGFESLGISRTQSLTLLDQYQAIQQAPTFTTSNSSPLADDVSVTTNEDTSISGQVSATDPNPDDSLTFSISSSPENGIVTINPVTGLWQYTPNENYDGSDSFEVTVDDGNGGTDTVVVNVDVTPIPAISVSGDAQVDEGSDATYTVNFDKASNQTTTLKLTLSLGSAEGEDLSGMSVEVLSPSSNSGSSQRIVLVVGADGTVEVPAGVTSLRVTVNTTQDTTFEGSEEYQLNVEPVFGLVGDGAGNRSASTAILDNTDNDSDLPQLTVSNESSFEDNTAVFDIALSNDVDGDVTYNFALSIEGQSAEFADFATNPISVSYQLDGVTQSAEANQDGTYTIPGNATNIQVSVETLDDDIFEGSESFKLDVSANATVGDDSFNLSESGTGIITDEQVGGSNADTPTLSVGSESVVEGDTVVFDVTLSNDVDGDVTYNFSLNFNEQTATLDDFAVNPLNVSYQVNGLPQTAVANQDGSYTIPGNATNIQVSVETTDDSIFEGNESFTLDVSANATTGGESFNLNESGAGTISDESDRPDLTVTGAGTVSEADVATFSINLSNPVDHAVTLDLRAKTNGNANTAEADDIGEMRAYYLDGDDKVYLDFDGREISVPAGVQDIFVEVDTVDDNASPVHEGSERFQLVVRDVDGVTTDSNGKAKAAAFIDDSGNGAGDNPDDDRPEITSISSPTVDEGGTAVFDVTLSNPSELATPVTMTLANGTAESDDYTSNQITVNFADGTSTVVNAVNGAFSFDVPEGNDSYTVSVETTDDNNAPVYEGDETFTLSGASSS